jgi:hypothetical protein
MVKQRVCEYRNQQSTLLRIDAASHRVTAQWKLSGCYGPGGLAYGPSANHLFSACGDKMAVTDARTGNQVTVVPIGNGRCSLVRLQKKACLTFYLGMATAHKIAGSQSHSESRRYQLEDQTDGEPERFVLEW